MPILKNKSGFTLVELLIVVSMLAIVSFAIAASIIDSNKNLSFNSAYSSTLSTLRSARSFAVTNKQVDGSTIERLGVEIASDHVTLFDDNGTGAYELDGDDTIIDLQTADCDQSGQTLCFSDYSIEIDAESGLTLPVYLFYETGSAQVSVFDEPGVFLDKTTVKCVAFLLAEVDGEWEKYMVLFLVSGIVEAFDESITC